MKAAAQDVDVHEKRSRRPLTDGQKHTLLIVDHPDHDVYAQLPEPMCYPVDTTIIALDAPAFAADDALHIVCSQSRAVVHHNGNEVSIDHPDRLPTALADNLTRTLAPYRRSGELDAAANAFAAAQGNLYADTLDIDIVRQWGLLNTATTDLDILRAKKTPDDMMKVLVGYSRRSRHPWYIDFKNLNDGPHVVMHGVTGSGKSETLRTIVFGLAVTHSPDECVFIAIDFKGGSAITRHFRNLVHLDCLITNNDTVGEGFAEKRICHMLQGELERREQFFSAMQDRFPEHDIKDQDSYNGFVKRNPGLGLPTLPYILIVFDEFKEASDMFRTLIKVIEHAGTKGRSLGMHLLLLSQNLDMQVLNEQLRSNCVGRISLSGSMMAHRGLMPNMGDLPPLPETTGEDGKVRVTPGAAYFGHMDKAQDIVQALMIKTHFTQYSDAPSDHRGDDVFLRDYFKPRLLSAGVDDTDHDIQDMYRRQGHATVDDLVREYLAPPADDAQQTHVATDQRSVPTLIDFLADRDSEYEPHRMWQPEINEPADLDDVLALYGRTFPDATTFTRPAPCGIVDLPRLHTQEPLMVHFSRNTIIYGKAQSGRSTAITTAVLAASRINSPYDVQFYILSSASQVKALQPLKHVGDISDSHDQDASQRVLENVSKIIKDRSTSWRQNRIANRADFHTKRGPDELHGDVVLIVDDLDALGMDTLDRIHPIVKTGHDYGVYTLLTSNHHATAAARKVLEFVPAVIELKLSESMNSCMNKWNQEDVPSIPGRGLVSASGTGAARKQDLDQFQKLPRPSAHHIMFATPRKMSTGDTETKIGDYSRESNALWETCAAAPRTPTLPDRAYLKDYTSADTADRDLVIGVRQVDLSPQIWNTRNDHFLVCLGSPKAGKTTLLHTLCYQLARQQEINPVDLKPYVFIVSRKTTLVNIVPDGQYTMYANTIANGNSALASVAGKLPAPVNVGALNQDELARYQAEQRSKEIREVFVVIDDIEFAEGLDFSILEPLLPHAQSTGLRVVFTYTPQQRGYGTVTNFVNSFKSLPAAALILSTDESIIDVWAKQRGCQRDPGRATYVQAGETPALIQVPLTGPES